MESRAREDGRIRMVERVLSGCLNSEALVEKRVAQFLTSAPPGLNDEINDTSSNQRWMYGLVCVFIIIK